MHVRRYSGGLVGVLLLSGPAGGQPLDRQGRRDRARSPKAARPARLVLGDALFADFPAIREAVLRLERGQARRARAAFIEARPDLPAALRPPLDYLIARCDLALGWHEEADEGLRLAGRSMPALADHTRSLRARLAFRRGELALAEALADGLPPSEPDALELNLELARRALDEGRALDARRALDRAGPSAHWPWEHARVALWRAQAQRALDADAPAYFAALAALWRGWPRTRAGRTALRHLIDADWPAPLTVDELIEAARKRARRKGSRGRKLARLARERLPEQTKGLDAMLVIARQPLGWARRTLKDIGDTLDQAPVAAVRDVLLLRRARAWRKLGKLDRALAAYAEAADQASSPRRRGRAAFDGGMLARKLNQTTAARPLLTKAVHALDAQADARERAAALWSLGWVAWREGDLKTADQVWATLADEHPGLHDRSRRSYYERVAYWRGRVFEAQGKRDEAHRQWRFVRDRFPLSYYAVLAHDRLSDGRALVPHAHPEAAQAATPPTEIPLDLGGPSLLWRLGLTGDARDALRHRFNLGQLDRDGTLLLSAVYRARNDYWKAHWVVQFSDPLDVYPVGAGRNRWLAAYPRPYDRAVRSAAKRHGLDPHLIWAVMRQESGFRIRARSGAAALGLMQVLYPTAVGESKRLKERATPSRAQVMQVWPNIHYGASYLGRQLRRYQGNVALALAAYNAGPGNVDDWLGRFGDLPIDAFVEEIPFGEARGYVRKVLRSYAAYRGVYGDGLPWVLGSPALARAAREGQ